MQNNKNGFTLIELLVVVLIIGILSAVAVPQYYKAVDKSRATNLVTGLKTLTEGVNLYYLENGSYPSTMGYLYSGQNNLDSIGLTVAPSESKYAYYIWDNGEARVSSSGLKKNFTLKNFVSGGKVTSSCCQDATGNGCVYFPDWTKCS